ncbi:MAG: ubiquitin [Clostridium sp.]|uniref:ubiquitin n=1 Tax=Clostridium sp. TaxID=1506 RepID=UPI003EE6C115
MIIMKGVFMENLKLIEKLRNEVNISSDEAKTALELNNFDMLDSILYLENEGIIEKPRVSIFYTNESIKEDNLNLDKEEIKDSRKRENNSVGFFETVCRWIDTLNNIFLEVKKEKKIFLKIPLTVLIVLLFLGFWMLIPIIIIGTFLDFEFSIVSKRIDEKKLEKVNRIFNKVSISVRSMKLKVKEEIKNDKNSNC